MPYFYSYLGPYCHCNSNNKLNCSLYWQKIEIQQKAEEEEEEEEKEKEEEEKEEETATDKDAKAVERLQDAAGEALCNTRN